MNTKDTLNRAYANWIKDGLVEIMAGILLTGVGALRAIIHFAGVKTPAYYWLSAGLFLFMLVVAGGGGYIVKLLKARVTYPRTGFTAFRPHKYNFKKQLVLFVVAMILGGTVGYMATQPNQQRIGAIVPIGLSIIASILFTYAAQRVEQRRLYYLAAISIVLGFLIAALGVGVVLGLSYFYLSIGLVLIASGCVGLLHFLRNHEMVDHETGRVNEQ
jgi:hypothetical protein